MVVVEGDAIVLLMLVRNPILFCRIIIVIDDDLLSCQSLLGLYEHELLYS